MYQHLRGSSRVSIPTCIWRRAPPPDRSRPPPRPIRTAIPGSNEASPRPAHGKPRMHGWGPPRGPGEPIPRSTPLLGPVPRGHVPEALHLALLAPTPETPAHDLPKEVSWRLSTALSTCAREIGWVHVSKATQSMRQTGVGGGARRHRKVKTSSRWALCRRVRPADVVGRLLSEAPVQAARAQVRRGPSLD